MLRTRGVLAIIGIGVLTVGSVLYSRDRDAAALALFAVGFGIAALWAGLGMLAAQNGVENFPPETYLSAGASALALTLYFAIRSHRLAFDRRR